MMAQLRGNVNIISIVFRMALLFPPSLLPRTAVGDKLLQESRKKIWVPYQVRNYKKGFRTVRFPKGLFQVQGL